MTKIFNSHILDEYIFFIFVHMKKRIFSILVIVAALATACSHPSDVISCLKKAEGLMMEKPDSARYILENIDTSSLHSFRTKARYSLLHTMSIDRCGIDTTDYALIKPADTYYLKFGNPGERTRMHFYKGRLHYNNKDYDSALKEFLVALHFSERLNDFWLKGMICAWTASVYHENYSNSEELQYRLKAYDYFLQNGDEKYFDNATYFLAFAYHNNRDFSKSDSLYLLISPTSRFYPDALVGLANNEVFKDNFDASRAANLFKEAQELGAWFSLDMYYQYAYALLHNGQLEQCNSFLARLKDVPDNVKTLFWKYLIARDKGDFEQALSILEKYREESGEFVIMQQSQSAYKSVSDYYSTLSRQSEEKATKVMLLSVIGVLGLLSLVLVFIILKQRQLILVREERDELEKNNRELTQALYELKACEKDDTLNKELAEQKWKSYIKMYRRQFATLGKLYGKDVRKSVLPEQLETFVIDIFHELSDKEVRFGDFEQRLNKDLDNIMLKYRQDFPRETKDHYRFASLVFAGFTDPAIASILGENTTGISSKKTRMKKRVFETDTPNKDFYSVFFD
ncbi:MAG: hypothetical protein J5533_08875 [Bacteroidales bacterium]|nr:hypothetical protein [Bacteroidales bacterium]